MGAISRVPRRPRLRRGQHAREIAPTLKRAVYLTDTGNEGELRVYESVRERASALGVALAVHDGIRPGDLPVERPTAIRSVVNLRAARAQRIVLPTSILLAADETID